MTVSAAELLREMVSVCSFSGEESAVADMIQQRLFLQGIGVSRVGNNLWATGRHFNPSLPVLMLNSHLDTVRPSSGYTFEPFNPPFTEDVVRGLGSNDAGASVVSMVETFCYFYEKELPFNLLLALSCEEENSGPGGMSLLYKSLPQIDCAIIGEPTKMEAAVAERGLLVIDAVAHGVSGHAAREEGVNAILIAHEDISVLRGLEFERVSPLMGRVKLSVTRIEAGREHNVIPDKCSFTLDIRPNELYTNEEIVNLLKGKVKSELKARSLTNRCSITPEGHPLVKCTEACGIKTYVSPTTSDWMRVTCPAVKMGPGDSSRSHRADEFVKVEELQAGIEGYIKFINNLKL
ncbi:MAG: acetylornithine deacetylase [Bacteroidetes bacterium HGW-Bacteroidetes-10]|nr:MAG: acetylornithine deacetylase [Bacteroidetes bacterium HGW-Bacteroidetes-10]